MNLGFATKFPSGEPTFFKERIMTGYLGPNDKWDGQPTRKIHTLRHGVRWKGGMSIHMANGIRTSYYQRFNHSEHNICISVQSVIIEREYGFPYPAIFIDGRKLSGSEHAIIAKNDGFPSVEEFYKWFSKGFEGQIVHWTYFKY